MFSTKKNVLQLLSLLKAFNISKFVVSPGSRHIPIVISMEQDKFFKLYSVVDERSASFFAIGLIQESKEPVGIICTSGTASANYCSAISEAYYQELPLLVITADRQLSLLDQHEDQMIHQSTMYKNVAKYMVNLPVVNNDNDEWYNNRLINQALIELNHHGCGPVQINIPIPEHMDDFSVSKLPIQRKIDVYNFEMYGTSWKQVAGYLSDKKIVLVCGEGNPLTKEEQAALDTFISKFDCIVLSDKMSNCHHDYAIENAFPVLQAMSRGDVEDCTPDVILSIRANYSFNPEFKGFVSKCSNAKMENWYISPSGKIIDPFHKLTKVFEMNEFAFLKAVSDAKETILSSHEYGDIWKVISESIEEPNVPYSHVYTISKFLPLLPKNSILQLANSNSVRIAQLYHIDPSIEIHCNRGTDGIDGCMSTTVGFAAATEKPVFLMIGDLTFFYDMNALWNRQLGKNVRIILNNNSGGAIMHMPNRPDFAMKLLPDCISAAHHTSAKAWAVDRGFTYLSAHNEKEVEERVKQLVDLSVEGPVLLEVFTDMLEDTKIFKGYYATIHRTTLEDKLRGKAGAVKRKVFKILGLS